LIFKTNIIVFNRKNFMKKNTHLQLLWIRWSLKHH